MIMPSHPSLALMQRPSTTLVLLRDGCNIRLFYFILFVVNFLCSCMLCFFFQTTLNVLFFLGEQNKFIIDKIRPSHDIRLMLSLFNGPLRLSSSPTLLSFLNLKCAYVSCYLVISINSQCICTLSNVSFNQ